MERKERTPNLVVLLNGIPVLICLVGLGVILGTSFFRLQYWERLPVIVSYGFVVLGSLGAVFSLFALLLDSAGMKWREKE